MRKALAAALAALATLVAGAPSALAQADPCPQAIRGVRGTNPPYSNELYYAFTHAADDHQVPSSILHAIAYHESGWRQYENDGAVVTRSPDACEVGYMQVDVASYSDADALRLATDFEYNVREAARVLREKWVRSQQEWWPGQAPADWTVVENWFHALCLYSSCGTDPAYPLRISEIVDDPLRRVVRELRDVVSINGFTAPMRADRSYVWPTPFKAVFSDVFHFYDATGTSVTKTLPGYTHLAAPYDDYRKNPHPDGHAYHSDCELDCGLWWLDGRYGIAPGDGFFPGAHFTESTATTDTARMVWRLPASPAGRYNLTVGVPYVPEPLGTARYVVDGATVEVDQEAAKGRDAYLGDFDLAPGDRMLLGNASGVPGQLLAADDLRIQKVPDIDLAVSPSMVTAGGAATLTATVTHLGTGAPIPESQEVTLYRRTAGATAWTMMRTVTTTSAKASLVVQPAANTEYTARIRRWMYGPEHTWVVSRTYASDDVRAGVRPLVKATLSRTSAPRNAPVTVAASVAPSHAGQRVVLQRYVGGVWRDSLVATLSGTSTASFTFAKNVKGTYVYRVLKRADADHLDGVSPTLRLTVT